MKKLKIFISVFAITALFSSCGATNCGCGLTSDAQKVELKSNVLEAQQLVSEVK